MSLCGDPLIQTCINLYAFTHPTKRKQCNIAWPQTRCYSPRPKKELLCFSYLVLDARTSLPFDCKNPSMDNILCFGKVTWWFFGLNCLTHVSCGHQATQLIESSRLQSISGCAMLCYLQGPGQSPQLSVVLSRNTFQAALARPRTSPLLAEERAAWLT